MLRAKKKSWSWATALTVAKTSGSIIGQGRSFTFVSHILSTISQRRLTVHVVIIPMLGYINQLQDNLIREKTKKQQKRRIRWWHSAAWFPVLMTFSFIWGPPCRSPSWDCAKKNILQKTGSGITGRKRSRSYRLNHDRDVRLWKQGKERRWGGGL